MAKRKRPRPRTGTPGERLPERPAGAGGRAAGEDGAGSGAAGRGADDRGTGPAPTGSPESTPAFDPARLARSARQWWGRWIWRPAQPGRPLAAGRPPARGARAPGAPGGATGDEAAATATPVPEPLAGTLHLIPISHLDTQWRWTVRDTVSRFLPATVRENAAAFARFPAHRINFDGAFRYALLQEHHPAEFAELRRHVESGRWQVAGATWDALDVNLPSPESFVRHCLLGRRWFRRELDRDPRDLFLPDCFGFGGHVPVLAAHCGLVGFATSKLRRHGDMRSAFGIPFPLGWWEGIDGSRLLALLDPGGYGEPLEQPPAVDPGVESQIRRHDELLGEPLAVRFFGVGDQGGAPAASSLAVLQKAADDDGPLRTRAVGSDELLRELRARLPAERLPSYRGELLLSLHGTGCYTSHAGMKRWNARNERLADAAEKASAAAAWLGALPYPAERLRAAWRRFLWHQFHDDLTGTSIPEAYRVSWNDEALASGELEEVLRSAVAGVSRALDTSVEGTAVVVFNPLATARRELVTARLPWPWGEAGVEVVGPHGEAVPAQVEPELPSPWRKPPPWPGAAREPATGDPTAAAAVVRFLADLPPLGFAVFDVRPRDGESPPTTAVDPLLQATARGLESSRYRLFLDANGDLSGLWDKQLDRDLLGAPLQLELFADRSFRFPSWEIHPDELDRGPIEVVEGPAQIRALPGGPAAVAIEVRRRLGRSRFVQRYRLSAAPAGAAQGEAGGDVVEMELEVDWKRRGRLLKATLTAGAAARDAVYDNGITGVSRGLASASLYEVPAQSWADLTNDGGSWGLAMLADRPHGWDHPGVHVMRMSLLHTPDVGRRFSFQGWQDLGRHRFRLGLAGHAGDWRKADVPLLASRFRHPPLAFVVAAGWGVEPSKGGSDAPLGRSWSFLAAAPGSHVTTVKQHEDGGEWVVRTLDPTGAGGGALELAAAVTDFRVLDGCEDAVDRDSPAAEVRAATGGLDVVAAPHRPVTLALRLAPPPVALATPAQEPVALPGRIVVATRNGEPGEGGIGPRGWALPAELVPDALEVSGIRFTLRAEAHGPVLATPCEEGQRLLLPHADWDRVWLLVASGDGPRRLTFETAWRKHVRLVHDAFGPLAREDETRRLQAWGVGLWKLRRGFAHRAAVAWTANHCHDRSGADLPYQPAALFLLSLPMGGRERELRLPHAPGVYVFAATASEGTGDAIAAW